MTFLSGLKKVQAGDGADRVGSAVAVKLSVAPIPSVGSLRLDLSLSVCAHRLMPEEHDLRIGELECVVLGWQPLPAPTYSHMVAWRMHW
jgi:hypothetical protein